MARKIKEHVIQVSHAMVGNTIEHDVSVIIEFRENAESFRFSTYVLNENRPGIRKHVDNHFTLMDAVRAADDLIAERREIFTRQLVGAPEKVATYSKTVIAIEGGDIALELKGNESGQRDYYENDIEAAEILAQHLIENTMKLSDVEFHVTTYRPKEQDRHDFNAVVFSMLVETTMDRFLTNPKD